MPIYAPEFQQDMQAGSRVYSDSDLDDLLYGLGLSASGGGGGYTIGEALVEAIKEIPVQMRVLHSVDSADANDFAVMAGGIGAPSAITPKSITKFADYCEVAIQTYSKEQGKNVNSLVPVEAGPVNALLALYLGWSKGLKVFDCDGAGRAVPSLTNLVFGYNSYPIAPLYLAGIKSGSTEITSEEVKPAPKDAAAAEGAIRDNLGQYDRAAGLVCWGQTGSELKGSKHLIRDSFDTLREFGSKLRPYRNSPNFLFNALQRSPLVERVYKLDVLDIVETKQEGYDVDIAKLGTGSLLLWTLTALNENMIMHRKLTKDEYVTAPNGIAMIFDVGGKGTYIPLNYGDDLRNQNVIGHEVMLVVLKENCMLYSGEIGDSFKRVLANPPINYSGDITPTDCTP